MKKIKRTILTIGNSLVLVLIFDCYAHADVGVPMLGYIWPALWCLLVPIVIIEALLARRIVGLSNKQAFRASWVTNAFSTFIGVPVSWVLLAVIESLWGQAYGLETYWGRMLAVTLQAPWLIPYRSDLYWMVPTASMVLLIPFFFMSVFIECWMFRKVTHCPRDLAREWSWTANGVTYGLLVFINLVVLLAILLKHGR